MLAVLGLGIYALINTEKVHAANYTVVPGGPACIKVFDGGTQLNGQQNIRFYNACPDDLYINVCVQDRSNNTKLYQSNRRVDYNGNFTISTFPDQIPRIVTFVAGNNPQAVPPLCAKKA